MYALLALYACTGAPAPAPAVHLTLAGSSTVQPVAEIAAQAYEKLHPGVTVDVQGGGSSVGISAARSGLATIGMVSRALTPDEADLVGTTIGQDGITLITNAANPATALSHDQIVQIYGGTAVSWAAVGGEDHPITVINKEEGRATREIFEKFFALKDKMVPSAVIIGPNGQAITTVAGNPWAVAYVSIGSASTAIEQGAPIRQLQTDGVVPSTATVRDGTWPLMRPLTLVTKGPPTDAAQDFINFVLSPEGQAIVTKEDFVPAVHATASP